MKLWDNYKKRLEAANNADLPKPDFPTNPFNDNKEMKRAPSEPKDESTRLLCVCLSSRNLNPNCFNIANGCISGCRKRPPSDTRHSMCIFEKTTAWIAISGRGARWNPRALNAIARATSSFGSVTLRQLLLLDVNRAGEL